MRRGIFTRRRLLQGIPLVLFRGNGWRKASRDPDRAKIERILARHGSELGDIRTVRR